MTKEQFEQMMELNPETKRKLSEIGFTGETTVENMERFRIENNIPFAPLPIIDYPINGREFVARDIINSYNKKYG